VVMEARMGRAWSLSGINLRYCVAGRSFDFRERSQGRPFGDWDLLRALFGVT
jgi:hypothetical protein